MTISAPLSARTDLPRRYHPLLVTLHWLIAILVLIVPLLASEGEGEGSRQALTVGGIPIIGVHMALGITVLVLLAIRLLLRWGIRRPAWATAGNAFFDWVGRLTHLGLYFFTFAVTVTGLVFALQTNRLAAAFSGIPQGEVRPSVGQPGQLPSSGAVQPGGEGGEGGEGFRSGLRAAGAFVFRAFHELSWKILLALIILHVAAALYHQFIVRDNLLSRMWYGRAT